MTDEANATAAPRRYTNAELHFAARVRCECGAGFAHPEFAIVAPRSREPRQWECSAVLRGDAGADGVQHSRPLPFVFYEVKSESQPSAGGDTTRPAGPEGQRRAFYVAMWTRALEARKESLHDEGARMRPDAKRLEGLAETVADAERRLAAVRDMGDDDLPPGLRR